jgi:hypothetical protein
MCACSAIIYHPRHNYSGHIFLWFRRIHSKLLIIWGRNTDDKRLGMEDRIRRVVNVKL